ncbi:hypothetical protein MPLSOD_270101 [Mesorhizobium sp. SOD10]|nr:hypothetical protein MPLSOD_270101 [Mesorhizobium sp. SOD10]
MSRGFGDGLAASYETAIYSDAQPSIFLRNTGAAASVVWMISQKHGIGFCPVRSNLAPSVRHLQTSNGGVALWTGLLQLPVEPLELTGTSCSGGPWSDPAAFFCSKEGLDLNLGFPTMFGLGL